MILCDVGNTNAHLLIDGRLYIKTIDEFMEFSLSEKVYYICVNDALKSFLSEKSNFFDLEPHVRFATKYKGMGIDRICACRAVYDGVVVDAGSAITVDVMEKGSHLGGFILPGIKAYENAYALISPRLRKEIDADISLGTLPTNTQEAISYAVVNSVVLSIKNAAVGKKIYFTGGDGEWLAKFFDNKIYDKMLVFKGLEDTIAALDIRI
ncbi:MAG: type III pantothenate kinase [Campylobacteraceae bacterium]|nr:type III pantothenate kinase [Campylobacteraceae bacterium]